MTLTNERTKSKSQPWQEFAIEKTWNVFLFTNDLVVKKLILFHSSRFSHFSCT